MRYPTPFQQKTLWNAATGVSILVLGALLVGLIWLLGAVFGFLQPVLVPLIVLTILFGFYPAPILDATAASVSLVAENFGKAIGAAAPLVASAH